MEVNAAGDKLNTQSHKLKTNNQTITSYLGSIFLCGTPSEGIKEKFIEMMQYNIKYLSTREYEEQVGYSGMAHFDAIIYSSDFRKSAESPIIYVNTDEFSYDGKDFTHLMPIAIRHELEELRIYLKTGYSLSPTPRSMNEKKRTNIGHKIALRKEFEYAFSLGQAEEYLDFLLHHPRFRNAEKKENIEAYNVIKSRLSKK